jgi:hypothetical protein
LLTTSGDDGCVVVDLRGVRPRSIGGRTHVVPVIGPYRRSPKSAPIRNADAASTDSSVCRQPDWSSMSVHGVAISTGRPDHFASVGSIARAFGAAE